MSTTPRCALRPAKMSPPAGGLVQELWGQLRPVAQEECAREPRLAAMLEQIVLRSEDLGHAIATRLAQRLACNDFTREECEDMFFSRLSKSPELVEYMAADLRAIVERDPASHTPLPPLLFYKGFHALCVHRFAHALWLAGRQLPALLLQSLSSEVFGIDIHPAAQLGCGIMLDHGTGIVIGETAIVENSVSMLHEVTLGGTGKEFCDRHPVVRRGVLIGAGAKVLGRVEIGECAKIAASSVVLDDVRPHTTVAGVPAVVVGSSGLGEPASIMQQAIS